MNADLAATIAGRAVQIELSAAARRALAGRQAPLVVEMELYFSCLIRKRVQFLEAPHPDAMCAAVDGRLTVCFRPVMTRACSMDTVTGKPELEAFPICKPEAYVPRQLRIDFRHGAWSGEYVL